MNRDNYLTNLLQNLGFIAAISVSFFQFALNDSFKVIFETNDSLFRSASLVALILSLALIWGLFAFRYYLLNEIYFNQSKKVKYLNELNDENVKNRIGTNVNSGLSGRRAKIIRKPWHFTILQLAFFLIFLSLFSFILLLIFNYISVFAVFFYVLFICSAVAAISIFSIQLYNDNEYRNKQQNTDTIILGKIRERFVESVKIIFEYNGQKYRIFTRSDNPNNYFNLHKYDSSNPQKSDF